MATSVKNFYEKLCGPGLSFDSKNSWLWFFFENVESVCQSFTFHNDSNKMDLLRFECILEKNVLARGCKRLRFQQLPYEFEKDCTRFCQFLDKFPNLEEFSVENTAGTVATSFDNKIVRSELKLRIFLAVSNFENLKYLRLPPIDENDKDDYEQFLTWAPRSIQSLCLEFQCSDSDQKDLSIKFISYEVLRSLTIFKNLLSLKLIMSYTDLSELKKPQAALMTKCARINRIKKEKLQMKKSLHRIMNP